MRAQESNRSSGPYTEDSGLVPYCTKFYASRRGTELPGWRQPRPSRDLGISITVKLPSVATSKAQVNASPRYPRSISPPHNSSVPALPKVHSPRALMKVPLTAINKLELSIEDSRPNSDQVRLPTLRTYVDKSVSHHLHTSLAYSDLAVSNVLETPERILRRELDDIRKETEAKKRVMNSENTRMESLRLPISQNTALAATTQADFSDALFLEENRVLGVLRDVQLSQESANAPSEVPGTSLETTNIPLPKVETGEKRVISRIQVSHDLVTSLDSPQFPFSHPDSHLDFSPIHALPHFGLGLLPPKEGVPCTDQENKDGVALSHMSETSSEGDSDLFPELIENSFRKELAILRPDQTEKVDTGGKTDISIREIKEERDGITLSKAVFLPQISAFPELTENSEIVEDPDQCPKAIKDLEVNSLAPLDPTLQKPSSHIPRKPTFSEVAADIVAMNTELSLSSDPQSPVSSQIHQLSVPESLSNSGLSKTQKPREKVSFQSDPEHFEVREFPKIVIGRMDDSSDAEESLEIDDEEMTPPHLTEDEELSRSFQIDPDSIEDDPVQKQPIRRLVTMQEKQTDDWLLSPKGNRRSSIGKTRLKVPNKSPKKKKAKSHENSGTKSYKKGGSKTPKATAKKTVGMDATLRRLSIATDFKNLVIEEEDPDEIIPTPGLRSNDPTPRTEGNPLVTFPETESKVSNGLDPKPQVHISRRQSKVSNYASKRKGRNSIVSNTTDSINSGHTAELDPFQGFVKNLSFSLLKLIGNLFGKGEGAKKVVFSKRLFPEELKVQKRPSKTFSSLSRKAKGALSPFGLKPRKQSIRSDFRKLSSKSVKATTHDSFSFDKKGVPSAPESEDALSSVNDDEDGDQMFLEEEHELQTTRKHQDQMASFELAHMSMMRKIAEDLLHGTDDQPVIDFTTLPTEEDQLEKDRKSLESSSQKRENSDIDPEPIDLAPVETLHFESFAEDLGPNVEQSLEAMFQGFNLPETSAFTPAVKMVFSPRVPKLTVDTRQIPDKVEVDDENYHADLMRRKFLNQLELQPDYGIFLEMQDGVLVQTEQNKPDPKELRKYFRNCYLKRRRKEALRLERIDNKHVTLYAQPSPTFTNLDAKKFTFGSTRKSKKDASSRPGMYTDRRFSKEELIYFRLKQERGIESFLKISKPVDVSTVSRSLEELSQVAQTPR